MRHPQGIVVQVLSDERSLDLYDDPDATEAEDSQTFSRYVEAVTGATFRIKVMITSAFNFYELRSSDMVRLSVIVDGMELEMVFNFTRREIERCLLRGKPRVYIFKNLLNFCPETGQYMHCHYSFGALETKEIANTNFSGDRLDTLGRIQVKVQRMKHRKLKTVKPPPMITIEPTIEELPEKSLKGRDISNVIKTVNARPCTPPEPQYDDLTPISIKKSTLGCIPRSPSPAVEISDDELSSRSPEATQDSVHQEVRDLRARLALLERSTNVKTEARTTIKREREDDENANRRQRPRRPIKVETIDLTDD
ncbi:hypothetical protein ACLMJK_008894 [Lecanora helva]